MLYPTLSASAKAIAIHLDGVMSSQTVAILEKHIVDFTGIPVDTAIPNEEHELVSATRFTQLLIAWRFLEELKTVFKT